MMYLVKKTPAQDTHDQFTTLSAILIKHPHRWSNQAKVAMIAHARECNYRTENEWRVLLDAVDEKLAAICDLDYSA